MTQLYKFLFDGLPVRGAVVRIQGPWQEALRRRATVGAFPVEVRALLGEMVAAGVLMQSNIKFNGALVLQAMGDGPVKLAVAEVSSDLSFRATAKVTGDVPSSARLEAMLNVGGQGRCAITLDPTDKQPGQEPYQGVVALHGDHGEPLQELAAVLEHYMLQSEQLDTRLILAADDGVAAGLLIQRMPLQGTGNLERKNEDDIGLSEAFNRIAVLADTLTRNELLTLTPELILHRLFWEETLRVFEPQTVSFACRCSRGRVRGMLQSLGREESDSLIAELGLVEVACDFCGLQYHFDAVDVGEMFAPPQSAAPGSQAVQ